MTEWSQQSADSSVEMNIKILFIEYDNNKEEDAEKKRYGNDDCKLFSLLCTSWIDSATLHLIKILWSYDFKQIMKYYYSGIVRR